MTAVALPSLPPCSLYSQLVREHRVDAILVLDGGSDSLMAGDEEGLGDPVEDAVSLAAVAALDEPRLALRALIVIGLGADRFNDVSDAASLRAIAELTARCVCGGGQPHACMRAGSLATRSRVWGLRPGYRMRGLRPGGRA